MSVQHLERSNGSLRTTNTMRDLIHLIARSVLVLMLVLAGLPPAITSAQDASTPIAEPTEISAEPTDIPTEIAPPTETATEAVPTVAPTQALTPNTDSIAPLVQPIVAAPGQVTEFTLEYQITTSRLESGIHLELRTAANVVADSWVIDVNGTGGFGAIDLVDGQTATGMLAIHLLITAPAGASDGDTLNMFVTSVVHTIDSRYETGVAVDTRVATVVVDAPEPTPTAEATETAPATPELGHPSPTSELPVNTPTPEVTEPSTTPATPQPETPASPQPEEPTVSPTPEATIDLASELVLVGRKSSTTVAIDESRAVMLDYDYLVGFDRAGTTISAQMVNWDGSPLTGWSVQLNGASDSFHDGEHLVAGGAFDLEVTVSVDETVKANAKARLMFTVTVDPVIETESPDAFTFSAESVVTTEEPDSVLSEEVEGPMFRLDGGFTTAVVSSPNNGLTCHDPNATYPNGAADSMIPGQIAQFRCDIALPALAVLPTFSGTATIQGANTAVWQIAASSQVALLNQPIVGPIGTYSASQVSFSGLGTLSLANLLGQSGFSFSIYVKSPKLPLSLSPVSSVTIAVNTSCKILLANCTSGSNNANVSLTATVRDIQTTAYGGGGLTDLSLLGLLGAGSNGLVMRIYCDTPATGTQVAPQEIVNVACHISSLVDLDLLGSVASVSADVGVTFTDPSSNWKRSFNGTPVTGLISIPLAMVVNASLLSASADFTITLQYEPGSCVITPFSGQPLNAINLTADYHLLLLSAVEIGLTDGWASVPIQLEGASTSPVGYAPLLSASGVSFGTFQFSGAGAAYVRISGGQPTLSVTLSANVTANCSARPWYVTAQFSALDGYQNPGYSIPLGTSIAPGRVAFSGAATGSYANTTTFTPAISGSPSAVIQSTNTLLTPLVFTYPMALTPLASQSIGYYLGTVTLTVVSGTPP